MKISLCTLEFSVAGFTREFAHCDQLANYLATTVSLDQSDPFQYSNALSSIINEVLETVHQCDLMASMATLELLSDGRAIHIVLGVEAADRLVAFYSGVINGADTPDGWEELYTRALLTGPRRPELGVLRLLADHRARITLTPAAPSRVHIETVVLLDDSIKVST